MRRTSKRRSRRSHQVSVCNLPQSTRLSERKECSLPVVDDKEEEGDSDEQDGGLYEPEIEAEGSGDNNAWETTDTESQKKKWTQDEERRQKLLEANRTWLIGKRSARLVSFNAVAEFQSVDENGFYREGVELTKTEEEQEEKRRKKKAEKLAAKLQRRDLDMRSH